jgi:hypothetical protein
MRLDKAKGRVKHPAFTRILSPFQVVPSFPAALAYGSTPIMRAPIKANAAQIINALIGRVSPIH